MRIRQKIKFSVVSSLFIFCLIFLAACISEDAIETSTAPRPVEKNKVHSSEKPDPWDTVLRVKEALQHDDTKALWKDIYPLSKERFGEEQIVDRNAKIHSELGVNNIYYDNIRLLEESSSNAQVFYSADVNIESKYGSIDGQVILSFIWHPAEEAWQLEWTPSLILPSLKETGKVRIEILKAKRGEIFDRAGWPLAIDTKIAEVSLVPRSFKVEDIPEVNELLGLEEGTIAEKLKQAWVKEDSLVPICFIEDLKDIDYKTFSRLNLQWSELTSRYYPFGESISSLVGYVGGATAEDLEKEENKGLEAEELIGKAGLEQIYESALRGKDGYRIYISDSYEHSLIEQPAQDGQDLYLTIDAIAQRDLYERLGGKEAVISAVDPQTGEILILISSPAYDPMSFVMGLSQTEYMGLLENPLNPLAVKFSGSLTPGSTQKLLTAIVALKNGSLQLTDTMEIQGKTWSLGESWGGYAVTRYLERNQMFDLEEALVLSDNIFFARVATDMGAEAFNEGMKELGIGTPLTSQYPFALAQISNHGDLREDETILLADTSYGQGELLLPQIQLANVYSVLINGGKLNSISMLLGSDKTVSETILNEEEIETLSRAMDRVVDEIFADHMKRSEVELSGKSGTAEVGFDEKGEVKINNWFVGYERNRPTICLAYTLFDSQEEENQFQAHSDFADFFVQLYKDKTYKIPKAAPDVKKSAQDIPEYKYYESKDIDDNKELETNEDELDIDESDTPDESVDEN